MKAKARKAQKPAARAVSRGTLPQPLLVGWSHGKTEFEHHMRLDTQSLRIDVANIEIAVKQFQESLGGFKPLVEKILGDMCHIWPVLRQLGKELPAALDARQERGRLLEQVRRLIAEKEELLERISKQVGTRMKAQAAVASSAAISEGQMTVPYGEHRALQAYAFELEAQLDALTAPKEVSLRADENPWPRQNGQQNPAQR